jgi:hypothetical protein
MFCFGSAVPDGLPSALLDNVKPRKSAVFGGRDVELAPKNVERMSSECRVNVEPMSSEC